MAQRRLWTREEFILTLNLYFKLPFGKMHHGTKEVIELANLIGRTSSSIALRLGNFASCDPMLKSRGIKGMIGGTDQCQPYWDEFQDNREKLIFESEKSLAQMQHLSLEQKYNIRDIANLYGETKIRAVKTRVNQDVFRQMVMANYFGKCALSGIDIPELLLASHIIPWSKDEHERLNPCNGICLSALYDRAFDQGLIGFDQEYKVVLSHRIIEKEGKEYYNNYFANIERKPLAKPDRYLPEKRFLEWHMDEIFLR